MSEQSLRQTKPSRVRQMDIVTQTAGQSNGPIERFGRNHSVVEKSRRRREREQRNKCARAQRAIQSWEATVRTGVQFPGGWKEWVSIEAAVTLQWITRAVNRGHVFPPAA